MSSEDNLKGWMAKWNFIIDRISRLISAEGRKIVVFNVEAELNPEQHFKRYQIACETVKNTFEAVVTTSLSGEERIFWPYKNAQFYIREGEDKVSTTGDYESIRQILG